MEVGRGQRQFDLSLLKSSKVNFVVGQDTFKIFKAKEIIQVSIYIGIKLRAIEHKCWDRDSFRAFFFYQRYLVVSANSTNIFGFLKYTR